MNGSRTSRPAPHYDNGSDTIRLVGRSSDVVMLVKRVRILSISASYAPGHRKARSRLCYRPMTRVITMPLSYEICCWEGA
jgi:hypothetical protein